MDIRADILRAAADGAKKTHIVYRANLNFNIVKKYFESLIEEGLLELTVEGKKGTYTTTRRGATWLSRYEDLRYTSPNSPVAVNLSLP